MFLYILLKLIKIFNFGNIILLYYYIINIILLYYITII